MSDDVNESPRHGSAVLSEAGAGPGTLQDTFTRIYASGDWTLVDDDPAVADGESRSGLGSNLEQTATLRSAIPRLLRDLNVTSILDVPCGDFYWFSRVDLGPVRYIGADIVTWLVERNQDRYGRPGREFRVADLTRDPLAPVDLIFSRDCLVHLGNDDVLRALDNIRRSGATYLATTTFTDRMENPADIEPGGWRPLNLRRAPFLLPEPIRLINERCTEVHRYEEDGKEIELRFPDKSIGVWRIADL